VFFLGLLSSAHAQYTATVDLNTKYQTFEGWGTSLAWWANVVGSYPDSCSGVANCSTRSDYVSRAFDPTYGLGMNVVRYNIGGGENPKYLPPNNTYIQYRARIPGFLASSTASYDWTQDANQRWVLQQAIQQGVTISEAFSNSPPWWMTNSGSVTGATNGGNNLNPAFSTNFADYLTSVVQHYHDSWGITFRTVEAFNEPVTTWWQFGGNQEGCGFDRSTQNSFVKALGASLAKKNMSYTSVSASDENSIDDAVQSFSAMDSTALGYIGQVNTHTYNGSERTQLAAAAASASKRLWVSEYGDNDGTGMTMAYRILDDLQNLQPKSWIYWQAVDNSSGWGLMYNVMDGSSNSGYAFNQKYYVMGNFSKFLRPGYQFVAISDSNSVAAYDGNGTVAIVTASNSSSDQEVTYNIENLTVGMGSGPWTVTPYRTSANENLVPQAPFTISDATFTARIPANSVTSFVVTNPAYVPIVDGGQYVLFNEWGISGSGSSTSGQALEEPGWTQQAGAELDLWSNSGNRNQVWIAHNAGGNNWVFTNLNTTPQWCGSCSAELALDIAGTSAGSAVVQKTRTDVPSQVWNLTPVGDGSYYVTNMQAGLNLQFVNWWGNPMPAVQINPVPGWSVPQHWVFVPYQKSTVTTQLTMTTYTTPVFSSQNELLAATITTSSNTAPTGTVTFYDGSTALGQVTSFSSGNVASFNAGMLSLGTHYISAVYSGDSNNATSATPAIPIVVKLAYATTTSLTSSVNPSASGQSITFNAGVSTTGPTAPTGSITFTSNGTTLNTVNLTGGTASYTTSSLTPGAYSIVATYSGDSLNRSSSSSALLQEVKTAGSTSSSITLTSSPSAPIVGNPITLTAAVTGTGGTPTGKVYFVDGTNVVGSVALGSSNSVTLTTSILAVGTHSLTAYYAGDASFAPATSSIDSVQVYAVPVGDYVLGTSVNQLQLSGNSGQAAISVVTSGGFNQPITFSCSGLPAGYSCSFTPASITPNSSGIQTTQMVIKGQNSAALYPVKKPNGFLTALAGIGFLGLPLCWRYRRTMGRLGLILALGCCLGCTVQGCGKATTNAYSVVVTGTSLPLTHSVTVVVQK
jgi:hypothetical protein